MILPGSNTLNWLSISWGTVTPITVTVAADLHSACGTFYSDKTLWISNKSSACRQHGPHRQATTQTDCVCASLFTRLITQSFQRGFLVQPGPPLSPPPAQSLLKVLVKVATLKLCQIEDILHSISHTHYHLDACHRWDRPHTTSLNMAMSPVIS